MPSSYYLLVSVLILVAVACSSNARPMQQASRDSKEDAEAQWTNLLSGLRFRPSSSAKKEDTQAQWRSILSGLLPSSSAKKEDAQAQWRSILSGLLPSSSAKTEQAQTEQNIVRDYFRALRGQFPFEDQEQKKGTEQLFQDDVRSLQNLINQLTPSAKQQSILSGLSSLIREYEGNKRDQAQKETFDLQNAFDTFQRFFPTQNEKDKASEEVFLRPFQKTATKMDDAAQQYFTKTLQKFHNWLPGRRVTQPPPTSPTTYMYNTDSTTTEDYNMYNMYEELANELRALED